MQEKQKFQLDVQEEVMMELPLMVMPPTGEPIEAGQKVGSTLTCMIFVVVSKTVRLAWDGPPNGQGQLTVVGYGAGTVVSSSFAQAHGFNNDVGSFKAILTIL
ncbi:unnamed protein product [Sympodiomycopsis kandeliae]